MYPRAVTAEWHSCAGNRYSEMNSVACTLHVVQKVPNTFLQSEKVSRTVPFPSNNTLLITVLTTLRAAPYTRVILFGQSSRQYVKSNHS